MRSLSLLALASCMCQSAFAAHAQSHTRSAMLSQTAQAQPITIKTTPQFNLNLQQLIEPKTGSPTVSVGSPAMSVTSSVSSEGSTESPLNSGRLIIDSGEKLNPLPEPTAATTTSASVSNQTPATSSLSQNIAAITLTLTAKPEATARAEAEAKTKQAQAKTAVTSPQCNYMNFGDPDFDPSIRAVEPEIAPELDRGMIGYNTAKRYAKQEASSQGARSEEAWIRFYRNLMYPSARCMRKSNSSPEGFECFEYPCPPKRD